ncbi:hypothetical protein F383_34018 [Gossypium arboreum]|uniref:Uncharacterized protein n=1 Tax=Gossypium arboreum TaxID=29729 RepID=A0A0B0N3J2_GOSAR|nr:hypothetical protein F383_34018 [Gossypium arboreum]
MVAWLHSMALTFTKSVYSNYIPMCSTGES